MAVFLSGCNFIPGKNKEVSNNKANETVKEDIFSGSLKAAMELGVPFKCTSSVETGEGQAESEGVIQGKQYKGKMTIEGKSTNVIMKDNCMWSWQDGESNGIETCFEPTDEDEDIWDIDNEEFDKNVKCVPTVVTGETFLPPTNINFLNLDDLGGELSQEQIKQLEEMSDNQ